MSIELDKSSVRHKVLSRKNIPPTTEQSSCPSQSFHWCLCRGSTQQTRASSDPLDLHRCHCSPTRCHQCCGVVLSWLESASFLAIEWRLTCGGIHSAR